MAAPHTYALLHGELAASLSLEELAQLLSATFPKTEINQSSDYEGGRYLKLGLGARGDDFISFERCSDSYYSAKGDVASPGTLLEAAKTVGGILDSEDIAYRFEIYEGGELRGEIASKPLSESAEAAAPGEAKMVTLSQYTRLEDAQKDAARLGKRGIEPFIVHTGAGGIIAGTGTSVELQIRESDLAKLEELEDEIGKEIEDDRPYACPKCRSKNYEPRQPSTEILSGMLRVIFGGRPDADPYLNFKCNECGCYFRVKIP